MAAKYLRPRRGRKATAISQNIILKRGEIFFEVPEEGPGKGKGNLKMGDGRSTYSELPYFMSLEKEEVVVGEYDVTFAAPGTSGSSINDGMTTDQLLNTITSGTPLADIISSVKLLLTKFNTSIKDIIDVKIPDIINREKIVTGTLVAGNTSVNIPCAIGTNDNVLVDVYVLNKIDVAPTAVTYANGNFTLKFDTQSSNLSLAIKVTKIQ